MPAVAPTGGARQPVAGLTSRDPLLGLTETQTKVLLQLRAHAFELAEPEERERDALIYENAMPNGTMMEGRPGEVAPALHKTPFTRTPATLTAVAGQQLNLHLKEQLGLEQRNINLKKIYRICKTPPNKRKEDEVTKLVDAAAHVCHFIGTLPPVLQRAICEVSNLQTYAKGEIVCQEGAPPDYFYIIVNGRVDVTIQPPPGTVPLASGGHAGGGGNGSTNATATLGGLGPTNSSNNLLGTTPTPGGSAAPTPEPVVIASLFSGDAFGEIALLANVPRSSSVVTRLRAHIFVMPRESFSETLEMLFRDSCRERAAFLRRLHGFQAVPAAELERLALFTGLVSYAEGHVFFPDTEARLCIIVDGECRVRSTGEEGERMRERLANAREPTAAGGAGHVTPEESQCMPSPANLNNVDPNGDQHRHVTRMLRSIGVLGSAEPVFYARNTVARLGPGNFFGESAVWKELRHERVLDAATPVRVLTISRLDLLRHAPREVLQVIYEEGKFRKEYYDARRVSQSSRFTYNPYVNPRERANRLAREAKGAKGARTLGRTVPSHADASDEEGGGGRGMGGEGKGADGSTGRGADASLGLTRREGPRELVPLENGSGKGHPVMPFRSHLSRSIAQAKAAGYHPGDSISQAVRGDAIGGPGPQWLSSAGGMGGRRHGGG
eukprot:jgi/Mesvir1/12210/Mv00439-RA.1